MRRIAVLIAVVCAISASCDSPESLYDNPGVLEPRASELDFGEVRIDRDRGLPLFLLNRGTGPVRVTRSELTGADAFTLARGIDGVPGGGEFSIDLSFAPRSLGTHTATLAIETDSEERPSFSVILRGSGVAPPICEVDGTPCDDGSACTSGDSCLGGNCVGQAIACDDGIECTRDVCDPASGCTIIADHSLCPDDDPCSLDQCTPSGCEHPGAPNGYPCGPVIGCEIAHVCILEQCVEVDISSTNIPPQTVAETQLVYAAKSGVFQGNMLFVQAELGGVDRNIVLEIQFTASIGSPIVAAPVGAADALDVVHTLGAGDRASVTDWAPLPALGPTRYARVHTSSTGAWYFEMFDTGDPLAVSILAERPLTLPVGSLTSPAIGVSGEKIYFCAGDNFVSVDLTDPLNPGDAVINPGFGPCGADRDRVIAHGPWWMNFTRTDGAEGFRIFRADSTGVTATINHQYNPDGVHRYGDIETIFIDGARAVVELEDAQYFWVVDLENTPTTFGEVTLNLVGGTHFVGLFEKIGYFDHAGEIRRFDFTNRDSPAEIMPRFSSNAGTETSSLFAVSPDYMALVDTRGILAIETRESEPRSTEIFGEGTFDRLRASGDGYLGYSRRTLAQVSRDYLFAPTVPNARYSLRLNLEQPVFIDGEDGAAGVFSPRSFDELSGCIGAASCDVRRSLTSTTSINVYDLQEAIGTEVFSPPWPDGPIDGLGCTAVIAGAGQIYVLDRCAPAIRGSLPLSIALGGGGRVVVHEDQIHATVMSDSSLVLVDLLAMTELATLTINRLVDADYERGKWLVTTRSSANVYTIDSTGAVLESTLPLPAQSSARILGMRDHLALIAGPELGRKLLIADVAKAPAEVIHEVQLPTQAMDVVLEEGRAIIARIDGLTAIAPICRPAE